MVERLRSPGEIHAARHDVGPVTVEVDEVRLHTISNSGGRRRDSKPFQHLERGVEAVNLRVREASGKCKGSRSRSGTKIDDGKGGGIKSCVSGVESRGQHRGAQRRIEFKQLRQDGIILGGGAVAGPVVVREMLGTVDMRHTDNPTHEVH